MKNAVSNSPSQLDWQPRITAAGIGTPVGTTAVRLLLLAFFKLFFLLCFFFSSTTASSGDEELRMRARLQNNPRMPPKAADGEALRVFTGLYIESMSNFQAAQMSFDVDLYLYSNWRDPSLNHSSPAHVLINDPRVKDEIWLPDLYFANAKTSKFHDVTAPNFNLFIANDGQIASSIRITMNVACNLDLTRYPMDNQKCGIRMLSYAYVASQVNITWLSRQPTRYNRQIELPEYRIVSVDGQHCDGTYSYAIMEHNELREQFSCLETVILLQRQIGYHLVQSYIPTGLIVMVSWLSFWIDRSAAPARVTLSFTALLTLSTLLPEYRIVSVDGQHCDGTYSYAIMEHNELREQFSCLETVILLQRQIGYHLVQSYIPTGLIVMVSWLSFWIDRSAAPARVTLSFTALLTLSTLGNGMRFGLPQVSYAKAIDFWFGACMFFVFLNLSEYAAVNSFLVLSLKYDQLAKTWAEREFGARKRRFDYNEGPMPQEKIAKVSAKYPLLSDDGGQRKDSDDSSIGNGPESQQERWQRLARHYDRSSMAIDSWSRLVFPATFALWNAFYWGYYLWYTTTGP